jgi:hypothetical protein
MTSSPSQTPAITLRNPSHDIITQPDTLPTEQSLTTETLMSLVPFTRVIGHVLTEQTASCN